MYPRRSLSFADSRPFRAFSRKLPRFVPQGQTGAGWSCPPCLGSLCSPPRGRFEPGNDGPQAHGPRVLGPRGWLGSVHEAAARSSGPCAGAKATISDNATASECESAHLVMGSSNHALTRTKDSRLTPIAESLTGQPVASTIPHPGLGRLETRGACDVASGEQWPRRRGTGERAPWPRLRNYLKARSDPYKLGAGVLSRLDIVFEAEHSGVLR